MRLGDKHEVVLEKKGAEGVVSLFVLRDSTFLLLNVRVASQEGWTTVTTRHPVYPSAATSFLVPLSEVSFA